MKLQFLGDARDAFKWDLLHWLCTESSFSKLMYVPLLTPDVEGLNHGQIPHHRFPCRGFIRPFLESLKEEPRSLRRIASLGAIHSQKQFEVVVFAPERCICSGARRQEYWSEFDASALVNSVVFFDPDNGFESITQYRRGKLPVREWIGHEELKNIFALLPETSVVVVYQHRPQGRPLGGLFSDLSKNFNYVHTALAAHEPNLAIVAMSGNVAAGKEVSNAVEEFVAQNRAISITRIISTAISIENT